MIPGGTKSGTNPDALIDKQFKRLSENERYVDPGKHEREYALAQQAKRTGKAFYPPKKSNGPIGAAYPNTNDDEREQPKQPPGPRGIFTNPMKKGCPGTPGLTLGKPHDSMPEPYLVSRELEKVERKAARARIPQAFTYSAKPGLFDNSVYKYEPGAWAEPEPKRRNPDEVRPKPFRPPPKNSPYIKEAINPVPEYVPDPLEEKIKSEREKAKETREKLGKAFIPPSSQRSMPVSGISPLEPTGPAPVSLRETILH